MVQLCFSVTALSPFPPVLFVLRQSALGCQIATLAPLELLGLASSVSTQRLQTMGAVLALKCPEGICFEHFGFVNMLSIQSR